MDVMYASFAGAKTGVLLYSGLPALRPSGHLHFATMFKFDPGKFITRVAAIAAYSPCSSRAPPKIKKPLSKSTGAFVFKAWRCPTLTWGDPTLPSALSSFTSEFEMGSGGSYLLLPPDKLVAKTWGQSQDSDPNFHETGKPNYIFIF